MRNLYRAMLVVATVTTAFLVSGKRLHFLPGIADEAPAEKSQQKGGSHTSRKLSKKQYLLDTVPAARTAAAPFVSATKTVDKASAMAGDTLTYTVTVQNDGPETANGVNFTDNVDINTSAIADSLWYSPVAFEDTFSCIGNVGITVPAASGVLANDQKGSPVAVLTAFTRTTSRGGSITLNTDGSFDYTPAAGFSGTDTVQYLLSNRSSTDVGVITINVPSVIWFINNGSAAATADGRLASPFKTISAFQAVNNGTGSNPKAGHTIFLYESSTAYTGTIRLLSGQKLVGQDATPALTSIAGMYLPPFSKTLPAMAPANSTLATITTTVAATNAVELTSAGTNYLLRGFSIGAKTGKGISATNFGTLTAGELNISGAGQALELTTGTINLPTGLTHNFSTLSSTSGAYGVFLSGVSGTVAVANSSSALSGSTTTGLHITGGTATISYPGSIAGTRPVDIQNTAGSNITLSGTVSSSSLGINIANNTGSAITFSGASKSLNTATNAAVVIGTNTSSAIAFTNGGLVINTTTGAGFQASGAVGSLTVTGAGNTISVAGPSAYTGGIALNVANATIGTGGLVFQAISSSNAPKGIVLSNTGTTAGLSITGTGTTAGTGGTIQSIQSRGIEISNAANISLRNINLTNANQSNGGTCNELENSGCNAAVYISSTTGVTMNRVVVSGAAQEGVNLNNVNGLTMDACSVVNAGNEIEEGALKVKELSGTCVILNSSFTNSKYRNAHIINTSGTVNLKVENSNFSYTTATVAGDQRQDCFEMRAKNSALATVVITGSQFKRAGTKGVQLYAENNATMNVAVTNCTIDREGGEMAGIEVGSNHSGIMRANIDGNPVINGTNELAVNVYAGGTSASKTEATVRNNASLSGYGDGSRYTDPTVQAFAMENAKGIVLISNNTITKSDGQAILTRTTEGAGTMDATVQNNNINIPALGFQGIEVVSGSDLTGFTNKNCTYLLSNTVINNGTEGGYSLFVQAVSPGTTVQLQQKSGTNGGSNVTTVPNLWTVNGNTDANATGYNEPGAILVMGTQYVCAPPTNLTAPTLRVAGLADAGETESGATAETTAPEQATTPADTTVDTTPAYVPPVANSATSTLSGETVAVSGITLPMGKKLVVMFKVRVNTPFPANVCSVSNQGQVSGSNFSSFNTNTVVTAIHAKPVVTVCQQNISVSSGTCNSSQSFGITATGCPAPTYTYTIVSSGQAITSPYAFPVGVTTVKAKASNIAGADSCTFTVTVTGTNATWTGTTSTDWNTASNWSCGVVPDVNTNVTISSGPSRMPVLGGNGGAKNISLGTGASLTINNGITLEITGDFTAAGTITANGTVKFSGAANQTVPAATYNHVVISNGGNKNLSGNVTINGNLQFADGFMNMGNHSVTLGTASTITGASATAFIVTNGSGQLTKMGLGAGGQTGPFVFPVGTASSSYTPATISNTGTMDNFSIRAIQHVYAAYTGTSPNGSPLSSNVVDKTWFVNEGTTGGSTVTLTLQWNGGDELSGFSRSLSYVAHSTGSAWMAGPTASAAAGTEAGSYTRTWAGLTSFSPFGVGSTGSALPVQLLTFKGYAQATANKLEWTAANESLQRYEVERSAGQGGFAKIGEVIAGNASAMRSYTWSDNAPLQGASHYRLRLIHPDGSATYSAVISISRSKGAPAVTVYPTPVTGSNVNLQLSDMEKGSYAVQVFNGGGQLLYSTTVNHGGGTAVHALHLPDGISKGVHLLQVRKGGQVYTQNVLVQ